MGPDKLKKEKSKALILVERHVAEFEKRVSNETDLTTILLKGHLLIEYYLDHVLLLLFDKEVNLNSLSFFQKIEKLKTKNCFTDDIFRSLRKLNDIRNNLAHRLDFKISFSEIDSVGFCLGKEYVLKKFEDEGGGERTLLLYVIDELTFSVFLPIFKEVLQAEKKKAMDKKAEESELASTSTSQIKVPSAENSNQFKPLA